MVRLGELSPAMTIDVDLGRKATKQTKVNRISMQLPI